jgi:hypothetical protein
METKLLKVRHISRPKFIFLDPMVFILKPAFLNVCGLHMKEEGQGSDTRRSNKLAPSS